jgi:glutathione S-transferase
MKKLFLLKADFKDPGLAEGKRYFCTDCALIEGLLSYYPRLLDELEVHYVNFARPRTELVDLIGEPNQSCPVLVLENGNFISDTNEIIRHLTDYHQVGNVH